MQPFSSYSQYLSFISFMSAPAIQPPQYGTRSSAFIRSFDTKGVVVLVRTGESPLRAGDDNGTDPPIRVNQTQSIIQFGEQCGVERVERFWAVERHECDA